ncbi:hypothetical protein [Paraburkholderia sp. HP33-1]|uniref:hypothetical protein n=1 Tax=Paraburkholderia sp. HP33-1 TaxID=2883243 RepID=UPI001F2FA47C|nr:hypothetical protein [Paraburkholderia sp. HP33-1]
MKEGAASPLIEYGRLADACHPLSAQVLSCGGRRRNSPPGNACAEGFFESRAHLIKMRVRVLAKAKNQKAAAKAVFLIVMLIRRGELWPVCH